VLKDATFSPSKQAKILMARITAENSYPLAFNSNRVRFTRWLLRRFGDVVYASTIIKPTVTGLENVPASGPAIGIFNHVTMLDPLISVSVIKKRDVVPLAKIELTHNPLTALLLWAWGTVTIQRGEVDRTALKQAISAIGTNGMLLIAPEGHRNHDGMRNPMPGVVLLANQTNAAIVPIGVSGAEKVMNNLKHLRRSKVTVNVGKAFKLKKGIRRNQYEKAADEMMYQLAPLVAPELRGAYADLSKATMETIELL
jgi:1-acyl-sn-glycerol-3-phosphate acyltransferase